jgi:hypothetical protein
MKAGKDAVTGFSLDDTSAVADVLYNDSDVADLASGLFDISLTNDSIGDIWESGQSFLQSAGSSLLEVASAVAPGILDIAKDVPFFGPISGILLKSYEAYNTMNDNKEALSQLNEQVKLASMIIVQVSTKLSLLESNGGVVDAMKGVALAVHNATLVMMKMKEREKRKILGTLTSTILSGKDKGVLDDTMGKLDSAIKGFSAILSAVTGLQTLGRLDHIAEELHRVLEMVEASKLTAEQKRLWDIKLSDLRIKSVTMIEKKRRVGKGGQGEVFEGKFNIDKVGIKVIKSPSGKATLTERQKEAIEKELILMKMAEGTKVLRVYGFIHDTFETLIVLDLALCSLDSILDETVIFPSLPLSLLIAWLMDVAFAVQHLHEKRIRHKDIKAQNMLVFNQAGSCLSLKIGDFGLAKQTLTAGTSNSSGAGTALFSAPEYALRGETYTEACDVFSIGMTAVQILTRDLPKKQADKKASVQMKEAVDAIVDVDADAGDKSKGSVHSKLLHLLCKAVSDDPAARPYARDIAKQLESLLHQSFSGDPRQDSDCPDYRQVFGLARQVEDKRESDIALLQKAMGMGGLEWGGGAT